MITLTDTAAVKVKELLTAEGADDLALRVAVRPGGCSGFSYEMFFDSNVDELEDLVQDTLTAIWTKLAINAMLNTVTALTGMRNGEVANSPPALELMQQGRFLPDLLITEELELEHTGEAFRLLEEDPAKYVKILIKVNGEM